MKSDAVIVVGAGLAGLVVTCELLDAGRRVALVDQEPEASLGGQAFWSLGGIFLVSTPEQRRLGIRDSPELAHDDWMKTARFDRPEDEWPRKWAQRYLEFASAEKRRWLRSLGLRIFPLVGWAERRLTAESSGNSVPRFHVTWGTGPAVVALFEQRVREAHAAGRVRFAFRHRVDEIMISGGSVTGVSGAVLEPSFSERGHASSRRETERFEISGCAVVIASGGIGGNLDLVRSLWPRHVGAAPEQLLTGVPAHVDGSMISVCERAGASVINRDRMWHYTEGIENWNPIWPNHGIRILPGPSSLWLDSRGHRLPPPCFPGFDTLGTLRRVAVRGQPHTWFVLNQHIIRREFALSGSEQNPDLTGRSIRLLSRRLLAGRAAPGPVESFKESGRDFVVAGRLADLVDGMNRISPDIAVTQGDIQGAIDARDASVRGTGSDRQIDEIRKARSYLTERLFRVAQLRPLLDRDAGPLIAVRLRILTRKTLGGIETDLDGRVLDGSGVPISGLFAAGEAAGFGGGGMHGYAALEGTFLGGCMFSGRVAGRGAARS